MNSFLVLLAIFFRFCQQQETTDTVNPVSKADYFEPGRIRLHGTRHSRHVGVGGGLRKAKKGDSPPLRRTYVVVEDNLLVFKMIRDEFTEIGLSEQYYDFLFSNFENINKFFYS